MLMATYTYQFSHQSYHLSKPASFALAFVSLAVDGVAFFYNQIYSRMCVPRVLSSGPVGFFALYFLCS